MLWDKNNKTIHKISNSLIALCTSLNKTVCSITRIYFWVNQARLFWFRLLCKALISGVSKNSSNFQNQSKRWNYTAVLKYVSFNLFLFKFGQISHLHFECNKANLFVLFAVFFKFLFIFFGGRLLQSTEPVIVSGSRTTCYREQWTVPLWINSERRSWHTVYATVPPSFIQF